MYVHEQYRLPYSFMKHMRLEENPFKLRVCCDLIVHTLSRATTGNILYTWAVRCQRVSCYSVLDRPPVYPEAEERNSIPLGNVSTSLVIDVLSENQRGWQSLEKRVTQANKL